MVEGATMIVVTIIIIAIIIIIVDDEDDDASDPHRFPLSPVVLLLQAIHGHLARRALLDPPPRAGGRQRQEAGILVNDRAGRPADPLAALVETWRTKSK